MERVTVQFSPTSEVDSQFTAPASSDGYIPERWSDVGLHLTPMHA